MPETKTHFCSTELSCLRRAVPTPIPHCAEGSSCWHTKKDLKTGLHGEWGDVGRGQCFRGPWEVPGVRTGLLTIFSGGGDVVLRISRSEMLDVLILFYGSK